MADDILSGCAADVLYTGTFFELLNPFPMRDRIATNVASASTVDLDTTDGDFVTITGTTTITAFTLDTGKERKLRFADALTLTHSASLVLQNDGDDITTAAGDTCVVRSTGGVYYVTDYCRADGTSLADAFTPSVATNSIASNVALNNISTYFTGPTVAQGTSGTWQVSGTVTVFDTAGVANMDVKLWDGTTVIASARHTTPGANFYATIALSGTITSPAGNLRLSVKDISSTSGQIIANVSGNSMDSTITAIRIA